MNMEMSTIWIGANTRDMVATVTPSVMVVEAGSQVQVRLQEGIQGTAKIKFPGAGGQELLVDPERGSSFEVTQTGIYYVVVTMSNPGKLGAMVVIIIDP